MIIVADVPYKEYAPYYSITSTGEVISKRTGTLIKGFDKHHGYQKVKLRAGKLMKNASVHRMVALAFIPTADTSMDVDHIDRDPLNNRVENLQWLTHKDNLRRQERKAMGKNMMFYVNDANAHRLRAVKESGGSMSGVINKLLAEHFGTPTQNTPSPVRANTPKISDLINPEPLEKIASEASPEIIQDLDAMEKPCCKLAKPCRHWTWNEMMGDGYINSLSGRTKEV